MIELSSSRWNRWRSYLIVNNPDQIVREYDELVALGHTPNFGDRKLLEEAKQYLDLGLTFTQPYLIKGDKK